MVEQVSRACIGTAELLQGLVSVPSPSSAERPAVDWLCARMIELGYDAAPDGAGNAVGSRGEGPLEIMLLGHIDTVPGDVPVEIVDGDLYGRGTVDAKGPLATFVTAGSKAALPPGVRLTVVGAVEEEVMSSRGANWLVKHRQAPSAVIIGEPSGWDAVVIGYKGSVALRFDVSCPVGHSAGPEPTAAELAVGFWNRLTDWCSSKNGDLATGFATVDATLLSMNTANDGLQSSATIQGGLRLPPTVSPDEAVAAVRSLVVEGDVTLTVNAPAYRSDKRSPLVAAFLPEIRKQGNQPRIKVKTGTSDMNLVGPVWGCPILAYGPGDSQLDHTPNEHVPLADLERATDILAAALERIAAGLARGQQGWGGQA